VSERIAEHATIALVPEAGAARRVALRVGKNGDSVTAVAKRYRVSAAQVAQWNQVSEDARFAAGSTVVVFVAPRATKAAPARAAAAKPVAKQSAKAVAVAAAPSAHVKR
jgi:membrane-bound lytic murein transglycosylase D